MGYLPRLTSHDSTNLFTFPPWRCGENPPPKSDQHSCWANYCEKRFHLFSFLFVWLVVSLFCLLLLAGGGEVCVCVGGGGSCIMQLMSPNLILIRIACVCLCIREFDFFSMFNRFNSW